MSTTEFADYAFTIKEGEASANGKDDAPVWLMCEPRSRELSIVGNSGYLGFRLMPGVKIEEAQKIVQYLREHIVGITYTK